MKRHSELHPRGWLMYIFAYMSDRTGAPNEIVHQVRYAVQLCFLIHSCIKMLLVQDMFRSLSMHVSDQRKPKHIVVNG